MRHSQLVCRAWLSSQIDEGSNSDSVLFGYVTLDQLLNFSALVWKASENGCQYYVSCTMLSTIMKTLQRTGEVLPFFRPGMYV